MVPVYDVQQPIEQALCLGLEMRVLDEGVVAGQLSERDLIWVLSLQQL